MFKQAIRHMPTPYATVKTKFRGRLMIGTKRQVNTDKPVMIQRKKRLPVPKSPLTGCDCGKSNFLSMIHTSLPASTKKTLQKKLVTLPTAVPSRASAGRKPVVNLHFFVSVAETSEPIGSGGQELTVLEVSERLRLVNLHLYVFGGFNKMVSDVAAE